MTEKKTRGKTFNYPRSEHLDPVKLRPGTLRAMVADKLRDGANFEEVVGVVEAFDNARKQATGVHKTSFDNSRRRAYEVIRILHYQMNYGLRQSEDGKIHLVEE